MEFPHIQEEWPGETVYIVAGGPSARALNLPALEGRKVIAVNSSYEAVPFAQILFFGDHRWFMEHASRPAYVAFTRRPGARVFTTSKAAPGPHLLKLRRAAPGPGMGLSAERNQVVQRRTSLQGATNIAVHLGAKRIVWIGADMGRAPDGVSHHHTPHRWRNKPGNKTWDIQMEDLIHSVPALAALKIEVLNASPTSRIPWYPKIATLEETFK